MDVKKSQKNIDNYLGCGYYQILNFIFMNFINVLNVINMTMMVFGKVEPTWTCFDLELDKNVTNFTNIKHHTCEELSNVSCQNLSMNYDFRSVVIDFDLSCNGMKLVYLSMSIQMIGVLIGSPIFGQLSDWFGRKWVLFSATALQIVTGTGSAWSPDIKIFTVLRFFVGIFTAGTIVISRIYLVELLNVKHRFWVYAASSWSVGYALMAFLAWLTADWRKLTILGNLVGLPGLFMLYFLKESPHWLLQKGKVSKAEQNLRFIMKVNRAKSNDVTNMEPILNQSDKQRRNVDVKQKRYSFWHLFTATTLLRNQTLVMCFCNFASTAIAYGILYDTSSLVGNRYLNFSIFAVLRYLVTFAAIIADTLIKPFGRKLMFCGAMIIEFCCCITIAILKIYGWNKTMVVTYVAIFGGVMSAPLWDAIALSASEIFPTPIRNVGSGCNAIFDRLGVVVAPQILYLAYFWLPSTYFIFALFAVIAVTLNFIYIPETKGKPLPEHMPLPKKLPKTSSDKNAKLSSTIRNDSFETDSP